MYDTHTHLNFKAFSDDYQTVIKNSLKQGMFLNIVGSEFFTSKRAVEIANEFKNDPVYATVGLHPIHLEKSKIKNQKSKIQVKSQKADVSLKFSEKIYYWNYERYKKLAMNPKVVAIGETGLDYYRANDNCIIQKQIFLEHLKLAADVKKPLIIHCRPSSVNTFDAYFDLIKIITNYKLLITKATVHCFLADWQIAKKLLDLGLFISFTGIITYKNVDDYLIEAIKKIPLDYMMLETDCPYLTPEPFRGQKRNEPLYVEYVARRIAEIKGISYKEVIRKTTGNGKKLFLQ